MAPEIETFLANGGRIRRFELGDSANPIQILEWINRQGVFAKYIGHGRARIGRATVDLAGMIDRANDMRRERGLEPFTLEKSKSKSHFCFTTSAVSRLRPAQQQAAE